MATSNPDWPPSPMIVFSHLFGLPSDSQVPLSCVPPWRTLTLCGLTERLWNWSVVSPLLRLWSSDGIRESICLQRSSEAPLSPRFGSSHHEERSTNTPLERITPPSLVSMNWNGLPGTVTIECWSGCSPLGCNGSVPSKVMSVPLTPASVERTTPRLFATVSP